MVLLVCLAVPGAVPLSGQASRGLLPPNLLRALHEGDELHQTLQPRDALDAFSRILEERPGSYPALWRAAREAVSLGMLATSDDSRDEWLEKAESFARRAVESKPDAPRGPEWLAVSLGRQALNAGTRERVHLAEEIIETARWALALDSTSHHAQHVVGEWHAEVMRLNGFSRFMATRVLGAEVMDRASWEEAEQHLRDAVVLRPDYLAHHLALARVYMDTDRRDLARMELREVLDRPAQEPTDPLHKQRAQELLKQLGP